MKQPMIELLEDLLAVLVKHGAELNHTTDDDGVHACIGIEESDGFFDEHELRRIIVEMKKQ